MLLRERARDREGWGLTNLFIHSKELSHAILGTLLSVTIVLPFSQCQLNIIILYLVVWIYDIWFLHLSADEHLNCFLYLALMNNVDMNILMHIWVEQVFISLGLIPSRIAGLYGECIFNFLRKFLTIFQSGFILLYCHQQFKRIPVLPHPANT